MKFNFKKISEEFKSYFNLMADKENEEEVIRQVTNNVAFRGANLWILIFAIFIASLGLNVNSTAVIIGAMLISPLMGPIIGMGVAVGLYDFALLRRSLKNYIVATAISVITATIYFAISPLSDAQSELLARTSPTLYDVLIAFFGGAAGVVALTNKNKGQVIPGVAIATALMPPLCTAGYGLATAQWTYFFGAFYLFSINTVFIAIATFLGVKLLRFHPSAALSSEQMNRGRRIITIIVIVTMIPATLITIRIIQKNIANRNMKHFVQQELNYSGVHILSFEKQADTLTVISIGRPIDSTSIATAESHMQLYGMKDHKLQVIQGTNSESIIHLAELHNPAEHPLAHASALHIDSLERRLANYSSLDTLSVALSREAPVIFHEIDSVSLGLHGQSYVAIVSLKTRNPLPPNKYSQLTEWMSTRTQIPDLQILQSTIKK